MRPTMLMTTAFLLLASGALAHHGWGSYDAANPITVEGPITTAQFQNPHATITVQAKDKLWTVTLAPPSRMLSRGATAEIVKVGNSISAYGYASTEKKDEMRAERIRVQGKTIEMR